MAHHMSLINRTLVNICNLVGLSPQPAASGSQQSSNMGSQPTEHAILRSGASSFPSYFINVGASGTSNTLMTLQQLMSHMSISPANGRPPSTVAGSLPLLQDQSLNMNSVPYASDPVRVSHARPRVGAPVHSISPLTMPLNISPDRDLVANVNSDHRTLERSEEQNRIPEQSGVHETSFTSDPKASNMENNEQMPFCSVNDSQIMSIKCQNDIQDESLARHNQQLLELSDKQEYHEKLIREMKGKIKTLESTIQDFEGRNGNGLFVWKIKNYSKMRRDAERGDMTAIHSGSFYSSFYGYKLCIRVNLNGVDSAKGTHLSLFIHFMQGEYDDMLDWPFSGKIILTVMDQNPICEMRSHISETLMSKPNLAAFQRPTSNRNHKGFGYMEFLPLNIIDNSTYVRNDCLIIRAMVISNP